MINTRIFMNTLALLALCVSVSGKLSIEDGDVIVGMSLKNMKKEFDTDTLDILQKQFAAVEHLVIQYMGWEKNTSNVTTEYRTSILRFVKLMGVYDRAVGTFMIRFSEHYQRRVHTYARVFAKCAKRTGKIIKKFAKLNIFGAVTDILKCLPGLWTRIKVTSGDWLGGVEDFHEHISRKPGIFEWTLAKYQQAKFWGKEDSVQDFMEGFKAKIRSIRELFEAVAKIDRSNNSKEMNNMTKEALNAADDEYRTLTRFDFDDNNRLIIFTQTFINYLATNLKRAPQRFNMYIGQRVLLAEGIATTFAVGDLVYHDKMMQLGKIKSITKINKGQADEKVEFLVHFKHSDEKVYKESMRLAGTVTNVVYRCDRASEVDVTFHRQDAQGMTLPPSVLDRKTLELLPTMTFSSLLTTWFENTHNENTQLAYDVLQQGGVVRAKNLLRRMGNTISFVEDKYRSEMEKSVERAELIQHSLKENKMKEFVHSILKQENLPSFEEGDKVSVKVYGKQRDATVKKVCYQNYQQMCEVELIDVADAAVTKDKATLAGKYLIHVDELEFTGDKKTLEETTVKGVENTEGIKELLQTLLETMEKEQKVEDANEELENNKRIIALGETKKNVERIAEQNQQKIKDLMKKVINIQLEEAENEAASERVKRAEARVKAWRKKVRPSVANKLEAAKRTSAKKRSASQDRIIQESKYGYVRPEFMPRAKLPGIAEEPRQ